VPALITQFLLSFNGCYNDYLGPLLYIGGDVKLYTVQIFIKGLSTTYAANDSLLMAGSIVGLLPTLILYLAGQKFFVEGIVMTGIK
jgi:multiple sugar transport system permease protein